MKNACRLLPAAPHTTTYPRSLSPPVPVSAYPRLFSSRYSYVVIFIDASEMAEARKGTVYANDIENSPPLENHGAKRRPAENPNRQPIFKIPRRDNLSV